MPNHKSNRICEIPECGRKHCGRGLCKRHLLRLYRYGDPLAGGAFREGSPQRFAEDAAKFEDINRCLEWPFAKNNGYGRIDLGPRQMFAHTYVLTLTKGPRPSPKHEAAHLCGNRLCCNPKHIRWATPTENSQDKIVHGTSRRGESSPHCKITDKQVEEIRSSVGVSHDELAKIYGCSRNYIWRIRNFRDRILPTSTPQFGKVPVAELVEEALRQASVSDIIALVERRTQGIAA